MSLLKIILSMHLKNMKTKTLASISNEATTAKTGSPFFRFYLFSKRKGRVCFSWDLFHSFALYIFCNVSANEKRPNRIKAYALPTRVIHFRWSETQAKNIWEQNRPKSQPKGIFAPKMQQVIECDVFSTVCHGALVCVETAVVAGTQAIA